MKNLKRKMVCALLRDGWEEESMDVIDRLFGTDPISCWEVCRPLYERSGANARFLLVAGVGHHRRVLQDHSTQFLAGMLKEIASCGMGSDPATKIRWR